MSDLISRKYLLSKTKGKCTDADTQGYVDLEDIEDAPLADIMECARAIKEYCRDRNNLDEPCEGCPFHFYVGYRGYCRFESLPAEWDLPEGGEKNDV